MVAERHMPAPQKTTRSEKALLDAALATALDVGIKRLTVTEVARRAGLSRMTAYRKFADNNALIHALWNREFVELLEGVYATSMPPSGTSAGEHFVTLVVGSVRALAAHPLLRKTIETDPEIMAPYVFQLFGSTQRMTVGLLQSRIEDANADGSMTVSNPAATAMLVQLQGQTLCFGHQIVESVSDLEELLATWEAMLRITLAVKK